MSKPLIMIVDDEPINLRVLSEALKSEFDLIAATNGSQVLEQLEQQHSRIDLILLDVNMPGMSGMEVLDRIKEHKEWVDIPVIFVTAMNQECDEAAGLDHGAVDYITKPISAPIVLARIRTQLNLRAAKKELANQNQLLEQRVRERTEEIRYTQEVVIHALTTLAETRDQETGWHIVRTQYYVKQLAELIRELPEYEAELNDESIDAMFRTAPLHDVGKVGIPDRVLLKPGKLDDEEWVIMRSHASLGGDALQKAHELSGREGQGDGFLKYAQEIAYCHHEKWDGSGYPKGLIAEEIPVSARLMAIADVYDALISKRCYKSAMTHEQALEIMREGRGQHFDPIMLDVFLENCHLFLAIAEKYKDE
jgi:putative two-component system response regulator